MNTSEVLTLLLVVFAALTYIDEHKKIASRPEKVGYYFKIDYSTEGNRILHPI